MLMLTLTASAPLFSISAGHQAYLSSAAVFCRHVESVERVMRYPVVAPGMKSLPHLSTAVADPNVPVYPGQTMKSPSPPNSEARSAS